MKVKVTTTVDLELKQMFDTFTSIHKKTYQDILERGMRQTLIECKNSSLIDAEIAEKKRTASSLLQEADALIIFKTRLGELKIEIPVTGSDGNSEAVEKRRQEWIDRKLASKVSRPKQGSKLESMVQMTPEALLEEWDSGDPLAKWNWTTLIEKYQFKDKDEAVSWFDKKIRELKQCSQ